MKNPIAVLRLLSLIEGVSFLLLLGVAMPMKYIGGIPEAVTYVGWTHGLLFVAFAVSLLQAMVLAEWTLARAAGVFVAALLPFGPFVIDRRLRAYAADFRAN